VIIRPARVGVGRALLAYAEAFAVDRGVDQVRLYTSVAMTENQRLYRWLGYREDGRESGSEFARVYFSKRLDSPTGRRRVA
jgi:ribosomal protein S18 acetylase RimI-like enzyme